MQNLNRLLERENKWYRIGPLQFPRGLHKRTPFYFITLEILIFFTSYIPIISPTWWIEQVITNGWGLNYIVLPALGTFYLQSFRRDGKKPERYLWGLLQYKLDGKHHSAFGPIEAKAIYRFATGFTIALEPRERMETVDQTRNTVPDSTSRT